PVITGASGAVVSTTTVTSFDSSEGFPAWSVCVATNVYSRSSNGSSGVPDQLPSSSTSTTKMTFPSPSTTVTVAPGSPVPEITGMPVSKYEPPAGPVITGASGAVTSTSNVTGSDGSD